MGKNDTESVDKSPQIQTERLDISMFTTASGREGCHRQLPGTIRARNQSVEVKTDLWLCFSEKSEYLLYNQVCVKTRRPTGNVVFFLG